MSERRKRTILENFFAQEDLAIKYQEEREGLTPIVDPTSDDEQYALNEEIRKTASRVQLEKNLRHRKK